MAANTRIIVAGNMRRAFQANPALKNESNIFVG